MRAAATLLEYERPMSRWLDANIAGFFTGHDLARFSGRAPRH
jgi:hypothetical protein